MKKTIILTIAVLMTVSAASAVAASAEFAETASLTDKKPAKKKGEIKEVTFNVHLHCENCVKKVQENIAFEKGVKDLHVCLEDQTVSLKYDAAKTSEETLKAAIEKLGYPVSGKREGGHSHDHGHTHDHSHSHGHNN
jgi:copper chaperone CopZ